MLYLNHKEIQNVSRNKLLMKANKRQKRDFYTVTDTSKGMEWYRDIHALRFLYMDYKPEFWYWDLIDTMRRIVLTSVTCIVSSGSGLQVSIYYI